MQFHLIRHWMPVILLTGILAVFAPDAKALPTGSAFSQIPAQYQSQDFTAGSRGLGAICFSRDQMPDGSVCNPAYLPDLEESSLLARVYFGNGYSALSTANRLVNQPLTKDFLQELFKNQNVTSMEGNLGLVFSTRYFSASFSPYRVQYVSEVHNPNLPVIAVHASVERNLSFSAGVPLSGVAPELDEFTAGARLRLFERNYVHGSFSLTELAGDDLRRLIPTHTQRAALVDPTLAWASKSLEWKPRISATVQNVGRTWPDDTLYPELTDIAVGLGLEPPVPVGRWRLGVDFVSLVQGQDLASRVRAGTSYRYGILEVMTGMNTDAFTAGLEFGLSYVQVGIAYELLRDQWGGGSPENRIATELTIRL